MPDIGRVLKDEITRLARREAKAHSQPLAKQVRDLKKRVRDQEQQIADLKRALARKADRPTRIAPDDADDGGAVRIPAGSVKKHRERLRLSQREMALLLDVATLTVGNWETGKSDPRGQNRLAFAELRTLGAREAKSRLEPLPED
jgi:DNA-binding transcriptional regulator YiaG